MNATGAVGGQVMSVSYMQLTHWLCHWIDLAGYDNSLFSSHSLRRGGVQWAAQSGIPHHVIKLLGDWKSQAYERYLNMTLQERYDAMLIFNMSAIITGGLNLRGGGVP